MKIPEFKRSGIGLIAEFHGIPNGFPNQGERRAKSRRKEKKRWEKRQQWRWGDAGAPPQQQWRQGGVKW
jgi:hypothetical protein